MTSLRFISLITIIFFCTEALSISDLYRLGFENRLLQSEYQLALTSKIYTLFDLTHKRVQIKAKGILLKELMIEKFDLWGAPIPPKPFTIRNKATFLKPKRIKIRPGNDREAFASEMKFWGIEEMPTRYRLDLNDEVHLSVRPNVRGWIPSLLTLGSNLKSYVITRPTGMLWNGLRKKPYTELTLYLSPEDARALYWSISEGSSCIIHAFPFPISELRGRELSPYRQQALHGGSNILP